MRFEIERMEGDRVEENLGKIDSSRAFWITKNDEWVNVW